MTGHVNIVDDEFYPAATSIKAHLPRGAELALLEYKCVNAVVWDGTVSKHEKMVDIDHFLDTFLDCSLRIKDI